MIRRHCFEFSGRVGLKLRRWPRTIRALLSVVRRILLAPLTSCLARARLHACLRKLHLRRALAAEGPRCFGAENRNRSAAKAISYRPRTGTTEAVPFQTQDLTPQS